MVEQYQVKGSSIRTKFDFVRETHGTGVAASFERQFDQNHFPVLDSNWYPFSFNRAVNTALVEQFLGGDVSRLREVGSFSANRVLTSVYKLFASGKDFVDFLKRAEMLHATCYNKGGMKVVVADDRHSCTISLTAPSFADEDLHIASGFYIGAAELLGASNVTCESSLDNGTATLAMSWS
jgi:hypothetical protein